MIGGTLFPTALGGTKDSVGEMSTSHQLTSVAVRIPGTFRRRKSESRSASQEAQVVTRSETDASAEARGSFISECTRQSLQVWRLRTHFERE